MKDDLRAKNLRQPSWKLVLKRVDRLIEFFAGQPKMDLNVQIRNAPTRACSIRNCGAIGCLGGWAALLFAPATFKVGGHDGDDYLFDPRGNPMEPLDVAQIVLRYDPAEFNYDGVLFAGKATQKPEHIEAMERLFTYRQYVMKQIDSNPRA